MGSGTDLPGDRHDVDNPYTWSVGPPYAENGTAYTDFLADLNGGGGFTAVNGWRLPTFAELQTILLPEKYPCTTVPCIDPTFGPTQADYYSSATTFADGSNYVWYLHFGGGDAAADDKTAPRYVRAVRGGL